MIIGVLPRRSDSRMISSVISTTAYRLNSTFFLVIAALVASAGSTRAGDWPQFLGKTRDGVYADRDLASAWPATGPTVNPGSEMSGQGLAGPAVAGEKLVLFHRVDDKERVECLDAKTGKELWSAGYATTYQDDFGFDEGPRATPAVVGGTGLYLRRFDRGGALLGFAERQADLGGGYQDTISARLKDISAGPARRWWKGKAVILNIGAGRRRHRRV